MAVDPKAIINPVTKLYARNPTHITEAEKASDQTAIAKAIKGAGRTMQRVQLTYENPKNAEAMPGIYHIRGMRSDEVEALCKALMRYKPNIFLLDINFGEYPNTEQVYHPKVNALNSNEARFHTQVAELLADLLSDRTLNIVRVRYQIVSTQPGQYSAVAAAWQTDNESYMKDDHFNPIVDIEYIAGH